MKISIVTVNWWADDFLNVLIREANIKASDYFEIVVVDNSRELIKSKAELADNVRVITPETNIRHGAGLDLGVKSAAGEQILLLDVDCHLLLQDWDLKLLQVLENPDIKIVCVMDGELLKPAKPLAMFFKKETIEKNNISFQAADLGGVKFDVGVHAYFRILSKYGNQSVFPLTSIPTRYRDVLGSEYALNGERFCYHEWYGTRFYGPDGRVERPVIDGLKFTDHIKSRESLFKQI